MFEHVPGWLVTFGSNVIVGLTPVISMLIGACALYAFRWLVKKLKIEDKQWAVSVIGHAKDVLASVVIDVNENVTKAIKDAAQDGKITKEEIEGIKAIVRNRFVGALGEKSSAELEKVVPDLQKWIELEAERIYTAVKTNLPTA